MDFPKIHESEYRFCLIMWEHEPVTAVELVKLCQDQLGWKRTTTYTVIKRLGERGVLKNDNALFLLSFPKMKPRRARSTNCLRRNSRVLYLLLSLRLRNIRICPKMSLTRCSV